MSTPTDARWIVDLEAHVALSADEIWPDGDAPDNPTVEQVAARMQKFTRTELLDDWALGHDLLIVVSRGADTQTVYA